MHCREIRRIRRCALQNFSPNLVGEKLNTASNTSLRGLENSRGDALQS